MFKILFVAEAIKDISYQGKDGEIKPCFQFHYVFMNIKGVHEQYYVSGNKETCETVRKQMFSYWQGV